MGVCLTSRKSNYAFNMGYRGFHCLRTNICSAFDKELGKAYDDTYLALTNPNEYNKRINKILNDNRFKEEDEDLLDFLFASDCGGKCNYKVARKIYNLIKNIEFNEETFTYKVHSNKKDYESFKEFLKECYQKRRTIIWY